MATTNKYDLAIDRAVSNFKLDNKFYNTKDMKDKVQCLALFWKKNKSKFIKYEKPSDLSKKLKITNLNYYLSQRNPSGDYVVNTKDLSNFLSDSIK